MNSTFACVGFRVHLGVRRTLASFPKQYHCIHLPAVQHEMESNSILKPCHTVFAGHSVMRKTCDITSIDSTEGLGSLFALYWIATFQPARSALDTVPFRPPEILDDSGKLKLYRTRVKKTNQVEQYVWRKRSQNLSACYYQAKTSSLLLSTHLDRSPGATSGVQAW